MMESESLAARKYYTDFVPTYSAQAIHKAVSTLYCCEDLVIKGKLGNGYFASVFLVHHRPTKQLMAMKLTNEASVQRREIELLSSLDHVNVLRLYGSCVIGARFVCLTEYANGGSLAGLLSAKSIELPWVVRIGLALDILHGLNHLHCHDLIHRDLTSPNILIRVSSRHCSDPPNGTATPTNLYMTPSARSQLHCPISCNGNASRDHNPIYKELPNRTSSTVQEQQAQQHLVEYGDHLNGSNQLTQSYSAKSCLYDEDEDSDDHSNGSVCESDGGSCGGINLADILHLTHTHNHRDWFDLTKSPGIPMSYLQSIPTIEPQWKQASMSVNSLKNSPPSSSSSTRDGHLAFYYTAVVADLGLCLDLNQEHVDMVSIVGNPYYTSPECLNRVAPYTFAADVFSFGLLVCELITRLPNDGLLIPRTMTFGLDHQNLPVPADCPVSFYQLAVDCCLVDHSLRPTVVDLIDRLKEQRILQNCHDTSSHICSVPLNS